MDKLKQIRLFALQNAIRYNGKANPKAILGQLMQSCPELRKDAKSLVSDIQAVVKDIEVLSVDEQKAELENNAPELLEKKVKERRDLFDFLKIPEGVVVRTAFPPEPSKYPHIGHAKAIIINYELAKRKKGHFTLRFEDTNPTLAKKEFYDIHLENYKWLGIKPDSIDYASNHMEEFYKLAEQLIKNNQAYICSCPQEEIRNNRMKGIDCPCRNQTNTEELWKEMQTAKEGSMILRAKISMQHKNSTMRDPTLVRIIDAPHTRLGTKYRLWPAYDFENSVMDGVEEITHRIRSKEFEMRNELQRHLQKTMGFEETNINEFARFNLKGVEASGRIIRDKIEAGELSGWDDPSLTTLVALRRRGFLPKAIWDFVLSTGISKSESTLTWDDLIMHNKRLLDKEADRYYFIEEPTKITIKNAPSLTVELKLHPEFPERGVRIHKTNEEFFITKKDHDSLEDGKLYRLMDCLNFKKENDEFIFVSVDVEDYKKTGYKIIHWLPYSGNIETQVLMPNRKIIKGLAEPLIKNIKIGSVIQFERFGFCRLDSPASFWYSH